MVKKYYSDYVRHALRFYARNQIPASPYGMSSATLNDWNACQTVFDALLPASKEMLIAVYQPADTMADNVYNASKKFRIQQDCIWSFMAEVERRVAEERGLI